MKIKETFIVEKSSDSLFDILSDMRNFEKIMPENLSSFNCSENSFDFTLEGMPTIEVVLLEKVDNKKISLISSPKSSIKFEINFMLEPIKDNETNCEIVFESNVNTFLKIMIEKPITNLVKTFSEKIKIIKI